MSGKMLFSLLGVLLVCAGFSLTGMRKLASPLPAYKTLDARKAASEGEARHSVGRFRAEAKVEDEKPYKRTQNLDELWKGTLFRDDRTEAEASEGAADTKEVQQTNTEFELVGLARIGKEEAGTPVAIIAQVKNLRSSRQNQRNNSSPWRPGMPGGPGMGNSQQNRWPSSRNGFMGNNGSSGNKESSAKTESSEDRRANRSIYRTGDLIGKTGYSVKSIVMEENKVIITRSGQDTVLILDVKNTNNSIRRENAKTAESEARTKLQQVTAQPNNSQQKNQQNQQSQRQAQMDRMRQAMELRRQRMMQQMQQGNNGTQNPNNIQFPVQMGGNFPPMGPGGGSWGGNNTQNNSNNRNR